MTQIVSGLRAAEQFDAPPWDIVRGLTVELLTSLPRLADRLDVMERLGSYPIGALQYVDDTTHVCPGVGATRCIISEEGNSVCNRYSHRFAAEFNRGPGKTACMPMLDSPGVDPDDVGCVVVSSQVVLGILLDYQLSFAPLLGRMLASGRDAFNNFYFAAEMGGFS